MFPAIKKFVLALLFDETAFRRWSRALVITVAASGLAYADQIAAILNAPGAAGKVKTAAVVCAGLSLLIGAGDKTPENVKRLANGVALDEAAKLLDPNPKV